MVGRSSLAIAGLTVGVVALEVKRRTASLTKMDREVARHLEVGELSLYVLVVMLLGKSYKYLCRVWCLLHPSCELCC